MNQLLENNSKEMATVVETFVIEETAELIYDGDKLDAWNKQVEELGLKGQTKIVKTEKSPIPFMPLKNNLAAILEILCPRKQLIEDYESSPIPLEILKLVGLSKREGYFSKVEIWSNTDTPDPVCVGFTGVWKEMSWYTDSNKEIEPNSYATKEAVIEAGGKHPYFSETAKYLIGKWADVKHSFQELREMALKRYVSEKTTECQKKIKDAQRELDDLKLDAETKFSI